MNISNTILTAVIENSSDLVYVKDLSGRYLLVNQAFARALGSTIEAILGKSTGDSFAPKTAERILAGDRAVLADGQAQTVEASYRVSMTPIRRIWRGSSIWPTRRALKPMAHALWNYADKRLGQSAKAMACYKA